MPTAKVLLIVLAVAVFAAPSLAQTRTSKTLDIYVVDVEGGNATLFVSPSHESLLVDTGNAGAAAARDAGRIMDAIQDSGVREIDQIRLIESGLGVSTHLLDSFIEIQGEEANVSRAERILEDYLALDREGHVFTNGAKDGLLDCAVARTKIAGLRSQALSRL